jgi:hypothetical protein
MDMHMIDTEDVVCNYTGWHKLLTYHNMPVGHDNAYRCEQTPDAVKVFFDGRVFFVEKVHWHRNSNDMSYCFLSVCGPFHK